MTARGGSFSRSFRRGCPDGTTANVEESRGWMNRLLNDGEPGKVEV